MKTIPVEHFASAALIALLALPPRRWRNPRSLRRRPPAAAAPPPDTRPPGRAWRNGSRTVSTLHAQLQINPGRSVAVDQFRLVMARQRPTWTFCRRSAVPDDERGAEYASYERCRGARRHLQKLVPAFETSTTRCPSRQTMRTRYSAHADGRAPSRHGANATAK